MMELSQEPIISAPVIHCARCGENHAVIEFKKLQRPVIDSDGTEYAHWSMCPNTHEPILMRATIETAEFNL